MDLIPIEEGGYVSDGDVESTDQALSDEETHPGRIQPDSLENVSSINGGSDYDTGHLDFQVDPLDRTLREGANTIQSLLSHFPAEILEIVFSLVLSVGPRSLESAVVEALYQRELTLARLCKVSRRWRSVAHSSPNLWTELPHLEFRNYWAPPDDSGALLQNYVGICETYLQRSKTLPITFSWVCSQTVWENPAARETLRLLVSQSYRWKTAVLEIPSVATDSLAPIRGHLPRLRRLSLSILKNDASPEGIDYFSEAPLLRSVKMDSNCIVHLPSHSSFDTVAIPWNTHWRNLYKTILEAQPTTLNHFSITTFRGGPDDHVLPPSFPCTILSLRELHFDNFPSDLFPSFSSHLAMLTLPSLTSIRLRLKHNSWELPPNYFPQLLALIKRSGCRLRELSLGPDVPLPIEDAVFDILALSPDITTLNIGWIGTEGLRRLSLDNLAPHPMLPNLAYLHIDKGPGFALEGWIDAPSLMDMFLSHKRVGVDGQTEQVLKQVSLLKFGYEGTQQSLISGWERDQFNQGTFFQNCPDPGTMTEYLEWVFRRTTESSWQPTLWSAVRDCDGDAPCMTENMERFLDRMEEIDFNHVNTSILERRKLIKLLRSVSRKHSQCDLGVRIEEFIQTLKPFMLRDAKACPYRWSYDHKRLVQTLEWRPVEDEELFWQTLQ